MLSASPRNANPRPTASTKRTVALDVPSAANVTALGEPIENENAPLTGCESDETTRHEITYVPSFSPAGSVKTAVVGPPGPCRAGAVLISLPRASSSFTAWSPRSTASLHFIVTARGADLTTEVSPGVVETIVACAKAEAGASAAATIATSAQRAIRRVIRVA